MAKLLLVDPDRAAYAALETALTGAGHSVNVAPSALFALTMLDWDKHDLVVSKAALGDMEGLEFCSVVKSDPATKGVLFVLVVTHADKTLGPAAVEVGVDMLLGAETSVATMVRRIGNLLRVHARPEPEVREEPVAPAPAPSAPSGRTLEGSLGVMDLAEVSQAISLGRKTGVLALTLANGQGVVVFATGRVIHAEFKGQEGEPAFSALMVAAQRGGTFRFSPLARREMPDTPTTISKSVEQLLLGVAADLDEAEAGLANGDEAGVAPAPLEER
jgi:DNA-binding response OmpR family regulator